jgi:hypothetical protein
MNMIFTSELFVSQQSSTYFFWLLRNPLLEFYCFQRKTVKRHRIPQGIIDKKPGQFSNRFLNKVERSHALLI